MSERSERGPSGPVPEELLSAYVDGEVSPDERAAVDAVLARSPEWRRLLAELAETRRVVRVLPDPEAPEGFWSRLADEVPAIPPPARSRRGMVGWLAGAAAAAAIVAAVVVPAHERVNPGVSRHAQAHAARASLSDDPVSELAPLAVTGRLGR